MQQLLSYEEMAALVAIPRGTLSRWVVEGKIPHIRLGARTVRFDRGEVTAWLDQHRVAGRGKYGGHK